MKTAKLLIVPVALAATIFVAESTYAFGGKNGRNKNPELRAQMQEIFANKDYEGWKNLVSQKPRRSRILEFINSSDKFEKLITAHEARKAGNREEAKQIREELGIKNFRKQHKRARKNVERKVTKIENGIEITVTSTDPEVVTKLQSRTGRPARNEAITRTRTNIENGVKITITSDDPELVEKIQNRKAHKRGKRGGRRNFKN